MKKTLLLAILTFHSFLGISQNPGDTLFSSSFIHDINITFTQPNFWDSLMYYKMHADSFNLSTQSMKGNVSVDGTLINSIGVQLKGNSSFGYPGQKKSIKLSFNEYVSGQKLEGLTSIDLNNNTLDPSFMRDKLLLDFMNKKGLPAPRCTYARVSYNSQYVGLYKMVEPIKKAFISTHFLNWGGNLFKGDPQGTLNWINATPSSYYNFYELHSNETVNDWTDLVTLIDRINNTPTPSFHDTLEAHLNTGSFIKQWAARNLFVDLDAYFNAPHNYYLYHHTLTNKFEWCTWDVSVAFGFYPFWSEDSTEHSSVLMSAFPLTNRMLADSMYRAEYLNTICDYLGYFSNATLDARIDSIGNRIRADIYAEPDSNQMFPEFAFEYGMDTLTLQTPVGDIPGLKKFITNRRNNVLIELAALPWTCTVGINSFAEVKSGVFIYPNPCTGILTIESKNTGIRKVIFSDLTGRVIYETEQTRADLNSFAAGVYFVHVFLEDNTSYKRKVIVSK